MIINKSFWSWGDGSVCKVLVHKHDDLSLDP